MGVVKFRPRSQDDPNFIRFWQTWPRKIAKKSARLAWTNAIKLSDPETIIDAAKEFADYCERVGTESRFIPHPSTWLNGERWEDELPEISETAWGDIDF